MTTFQEIKKQVKIEGLELVGEILIMIAAAFWCFTLIGCIFGIPMILRCWQRMQGKLENTLLHGIISIVFFFIIGGILTIIGSKSYEK